MARLLGALCGGIVLGVLGMLVASRLASVPDSDVVVRDIQNVSTMAEVDAEVHRTERYVKLLTIEQVIALPSQFARSEALYAIAGRADSAGLQKLIFEANRVADDAARKAMLDVLFFRLAELDPRSALALARNDELQSTRALEHVVWKAWARRNLEDALFAAKTESTSTRQHAAAQDLLAAFGYMGNATTDRIEAELGIGPDRSSRSAFIRQLVDRSPEEAIKFIESYEQGAIREELLSTLAFYLATRAADEAPRYAGSFSREADSKRYSAVVNNALVHDNPKVAIDRWLANGGSDLTSRSEFQQAVRALAGTDLEAALQYYENATSEDARRAFGAAIAGEMVKQDPHAALQWARENDRPPMQSLEYTVIRQMVLIDPQLALAEAQNIRDAGMRSSMVSNVIHLMANEDPASAAQLLAQIPDEQARLQASARLVSVWVDRDPDSAIDWILSQDGPQSANMLQTAVGRLARSDPDAAIRLLPRLGEGAQYGMRQTIAQQLAQSESAERALNFVRQFEGQDGYDALQASVIGGIARQDPLEAKRLADQLSSVAARDAAYAGLIQHSARTNPAEAAQWAESISDDNYRMSALGQVANQWSRSDPVAAERWLNGLPEGRNRDAAISMAAGAWSKPSEQQKRLINSIDDRNMRSQAKFRLAYRLLRSDPPAARKMMQDPDITDEQRQQFEQMGSQMNRAISIRHN
jgi:hypothetical protein